MKERKYRDRFRMTSPDRAEYAGEYYGFPDGRAEARRRGGRIACGLAAWWILIFVHLFAAGVTDRTLYALMPLLLALIPAAYGVMGAATMLMNPARMTVVQRDKGPERVTRAAAGAFALTTVGTLGCLVRVTLAKAWPGHWYEALLPALAAMAMLWVLRQGRDALSALRRIGA